MTVGAAARGLAGLLVLALAGCSSSQPASSAGDDALARGDLGAAAIAYESEAAGNIEALDASRRLRLALALAVPGHGRSDAERARTLLGDLRVDGVVGGEAATVLALLDSMSVAAQEQQRLGARIVGLRAEIERCGADLARLDSMAAAERAAAERATAECDELRARVVDLETAVARRDAELAELRDMIEDLKHVDLEREP